jgi:hypothetical protein
MGLTSAKGLVTALAEYLRQGFEFFRNLESPKPLALDVPERAARHQACPRWRTHGGRGTAHDIGVRESHAISDQAFHVRRPDRFVTQCGNGIEPLVVGEQEKDVGALRPGTKCQVDAKGSGQNRTCREILHIEMILGGAPGSHNCFCPPNPGSSGFQRFVNAHHPEGKRCCSGFGKPGILKEPNHRLPRRELLDGAAEIFVGVLLPSEQSGKLGEDKP